MNKEAADSKDVVTYRLSDQPISGRYGQTHLTLMVRCSKGEISVGIHFAGAYFSGGGVNVAYRVDNKPAQKKYFAVSSNREWALTSKQLEPTMAPALPLIEEWLAGSSLYVEASTGLGEIVGGRFTLGGMAQALGPVREACRTEKGLKRN